jgi:hypothetical protein
MFVPHVDNWGSWNVNVFYATEGQQGPTQPTDFAFLSAVDSDISFHLPRRNRPMFHDIYVKSVFLSD